MRRDVAPDAAEYVQVTLARRAVLRSEAKVTVGIMLAIHKMFKKVQSMLQEMIAAFDDDSNQHDLDLMRMAWQAKAEE